jgi:oligopeptide/dipeptide ABC transporter ATP-binding protein
MSMPLVDIRDLSVVIDTDDGTVAALSHVSLTLERGEVLGVVGESGAGKTMLARAITTLLPARATATGEILFNGRDVLAMRGPELEAHRGAGAALCFQSPRRALSPFRRVGDQISDRLEAHGQRRRRPASPVSLLTAVGIREPERRARAYPHELSGGMAQRVMISLALACYPELMVADEPTTGLDATLSRSILALFRQTADEDRRAVLIISHDIAAIAGICDRIAVLYAGTLVEEGPASGILRNPAHPYTAALLAAVPDISSAPTRVLAGTMPQLRQAPESCPFAERCSLAVEKCESERPRLVSVRQGWRAACFRSSEVRLERQATSLPFRHARPVTDAATPVLEVKDLEVIYGGRFGRGGYRALRRISLTVDAGETLGVVGESGCGKTTLARVALGLIRPARGVVRFEGRDLSGLRRAEIRALRRRMQMVFQDPFDTLDPRRSIRATLEDSLRPLGLASSDRQRRIDHVLDQVGLHRDLLERRRHEISGGQAQRAGIARALLLDPDLVIFDEPTSALDVTVQAQILDLIGQLMQNRDRAYVYISHNLATVRSVSDRVAVLYLGVVVEEARVDRLFENPLHPYTRALLSAAPSLRGTQAPRSWTVALRQDLDEAVASEGCLLAPRCPYATDRCVSEPQELVEYERGHRAACWQVPDLA